MCYICSLLFFKKNYKRSSIVSVTRVQYWSGICEAVTLQPPQIQSRYSEMQEIAHVSKCLWRKSQKWVTGSEGMCIGNSDDIWK